MVVEDKNTKLIDGIRKAVAEKGEDYVYQPGLSRDAKICRYFDLVTNEAMCLIGQGLAYIGYTPDTMLENKYGEAQPLLAFNDYSASILLDFMGFNNLIILACRLGQNSQDKGMTWGEALKVIHNSLIDKGIADKYWR